MVFSTDGSALYTIADDGKIALLDFQVDESSFALSISRLQGASIVRTLAACSSHRASALALNKKNTRISFAGPQPHVISIADALTFEMVSGDIMRRSRCV